MHKSVFALFTVSALAFALSACQPAQSPSLNVNASAKAASPASASRAKAGLAGASESATASLAQVTDLVSSASHGAVKVLKVFPAGDGITGAVTQDASSRKSIVFVSPHATILFPGGAFDRNGVNLAQENMVTQGVYIAPAELAKRVVPRAFMVGKKGPILTAFIDPNCYWCHELYTKFYPRIQSGDLRMRVVMVGFLKPDSAARAAAILAAKDPAAALHEDEVKFDLKQEEGGYKIPASVPQKFLDQVREDTQNMGDAGQISTPGLLFCAKGTGTLTYQLGMPQDVKGFIDNLGTQGDPSCK